MNRRLIDITEEDLRELVAREVKSALRTTEVATASAQGIVSGRKNIAKALGIGVDKLDNMIAKGDLKGAVKRNGRTLICDITKAFNSFSDQWNK